MKAVKAIKTMVTTAMDTQTMQPAQTRSTSSHKKPSTSAKPALAKMIHFASKTSPKI